MSQMEPPTAESDGTANRRGTSRPTAASRARSTTRTPRSSRAAPPRVACRRSSVPKSRRPPSRSNTQALERSKVAVTPVAFKHLGVRAFQNRRVPRRVQTPGVRAFQSRRVPRRVQTPGVRTFQSRRVPRRVQAPKRPSAQARAFERSSLLEERAAALDRRTAG